MQVYKAITIGRVTYTGVAYKALVEAEVSENTINSGLNRNSQSWQRLPDVSDARLVWIRYDTMADKYQAMLHQKYGTPDAYFAATPTPAPPKEGNYYQPSKGGELLPTLQSRGVYPAPSRTLSCPTNRPCRHSFFPDNTKPRQQTSLHRHPNTRPNTCCGMAKAAKNRPRRAK
ncbi:MAG: hypothetical protein IPN94_02220 [Sphingobacteriales bacterium]|nr:hypothetical protein [Sphingobacteriales bacterium]